jgi:hypothetical protein
VKCQAVYNRKYMQLNNKSKTGITSKELAVHVTVVPTDIMSTFSRVLGNFCWQKSFPTVTATESITNVAKKINAYIAKIARAIIENGVLTYRASRVTIENTVMVIRSSLLAEGHGQYVAVAVDVVLDENVNSKGLK